jgi:transcription antitermination factor NusG
MNAGSNPLPWFGLRIKSRHEQVASTVLKGKGYEPFLPSYKVSRRWTDRSKQTEFPLFPGYLFCRMSTTDRVAVLMSTGVVGIVGIGRTPEPIEEAEIDAIRSILQSGLTVTPWPFVYPGDIVEVEYGPLRGVRGVVESVNDRRRLVVSVTLLQRSISVELDPAWVAVQALKHNVEKNQNYESSNRHFRLLDPARERPGTAAGERGRTAGQPAHTADRL